MIYLDNAATTLKKPPSVITAVNDALATCGNAGRGTHAASMIASDILFSCRDAAGNFFGQPDTDQIVFTHNTTHALNCAIFGLMRNGGHCLISGYEHNSVVRPLGALKANGVTYTVIDTPLFEADAFLEKFALEIRKDTKFAVITHISNVFGYILPIKEIDEICFQNGISLIVDAAQSAGSVPIKLDELKSTVAICVPGHKGLYGPQGTGLLICRNGEEFDPLIYGGTGSVSKSFLQSEFMPDRHESGTLNIHGIAGLCAGIEYVQTRGVESIFDHETKLIRYAAEELSKIDGFRVYTGNCQAGVLGFVSDRLSPETIGEFLGEKNIAVRSGLHCSYLAHKTAGTTNGCVRISVSDYNSADEIETLIDTLKIL